MIQLPLSFVSGDGGFSTSPLTYTQLKRNDKFAVYERSRDGKPYDYEVITIKVNPKGKELKFPNGIVKVVEDDTELYPTTSQWGRLAWTLPNQGIAMVRFLELSKEGITEDISLSSDVVKDPTPALQSENHPDETEDDAKPYKGPDLLIPVGEFSTKDLAAFNNVEYPTAFLFRKDREHKGQIKFVRSERRATKGKPTQLFTKVTT